MKHRTFKAFGILDEQGDLIPKSIRGFQSTAENDFAENHAYDCEEWPAFYRRGCRCVPLEITVTGTGENPDLENTCFSQSPRPLPGTQAEPNGTATARERSGRRVSETMVGGKVIGIIRKPGITTLHVRDTRSTDECCVDVREVRKDNGEEVLIWLGDSVWWQGDSVLWTLHSINHSDYPDGCGKQWDIALPKVGYS